MAGPTPVSDKTGIEWCDATWNPVRGCSRVTEGCRHCYAEGIAARFSGPGAPYEDLAKWVTHKDGTREARWTGKTAFVESALDQPLRWRRPRRIFVNSMSDLFHETIPGEWIDRIFAVMALAPQHQFIVLTKRPKRMRHYTTHGGRPGLVWQAVGTVIERQRPRRWYGLYGESPKLAALSAHGAAWGGERPWPLANVALGVSIADQADADRWVPVLLETPAAVRLVSCEPLLGPIDMLRTPRIGDTWDWLTGERQTSSSQTSTPHIDWVIVGGESGGGARPMDPAWARSLRDQCIAAGVPFHFKQWGGVDKKAAGRLLDGRAWDEVPG